MEEEFEVAIALLLEAADEGTIDEDELVLFFLALEEDFKAIYPTPEYGKRIDIDSLTVEQCVGLFRFKQVDLRQLCTLLKLPANFTFSNGTTWTALEGLCVVLRRLAYPCRLRDLAEMFGRSPTCLSIVFNRTCIYLSLTWQHHLEDLQAAYLTPGRYTSYAQAIGTMCPLQSCWGFIDGTVRPICRPIHEQRAFYNGHKRVHALKYQSIVTPDGLIAHLYGPIEGRRHDSGILRESNLMHSLQNLPSRPAGGQYCLYGDPAYPLRPQLITPYQHEPLSAQERQFNCEMSSGRIIVEWGFAKVLQYFSFVDFKKNQKLLLQPIASHYFTAVLLSNCHTCLYGSEASKHFNIQPPSLSDYLS